MRRFTVAQAETYGGITVDPCNYQSKVINLVKNCVQKPEIYLDREEAGAKGKRKIIGDIHYGKNHCCDTINF